ncbi:hypothetical protein KR222_008638 [Zaprionus bogoriensis]|nr:hypothetical protein KR222_008638 [Zaprionus bogoriensis]
MSSASTITTCRRLLFGRCLCAVLLSVNVQFLLLTYFLLFVNFELLHPLAWLAGTLRLVCSWYTWFASIPLMGAVVLYGMTLSQQHLAERSYCATRYRWLLQHGPRTLLFLGAHLLLGYLTAWLYTGYLHSDYSHLVYSCYGQQCLSSYHVFLLGMGLVAGGHYFATMHMRQQVSIEYAIVERSRFEKLRELGYATLLQAPIKSLLPTLGYALAYCLGGGVVRSRLCQLLGVQADERLLGPLDVAGSGRLLLYAWLLTTHIWSNMQLMDRCYAMLLAEDLPLVLAASKRLQPATQTQTERRQLPLVSCLALLNVHVVQCLAAHFLYKQATRRQSPTRAEIFQLTEPGNRPANWRALCDQCLSIIDGFSEDLSDSLRQLSVLKDSTEPALLAEKVLLRQYNQLHGIRAAMSPPRYMPEPVQAQEQQRVRHVPNWCERSSQQLRDSLQRQLRRIPGLVYFFAEAEGAKTRFLLQHALPVAWLTQALAQICVASLREDRYGVVQDDLARIIGSLQRLNGELDKLANSLPTAGSANYRQLRCAVRRSLYHICSAFYDYLGELMPAGEQLQQLYAFVRG